LQINLFQLAVISVGVFDCLRRITPARGLSRKLKTLNYDCSEVFDLDSTFWRCAFHEWGTFSELL